MEILRLLCVSLVQRLRKAVVLPEARSCAESQFGYPPGVI